VEFIDLKQQYAKLKPCMDARIHAVLEHGQFLLGPEVAELEHLLAARAHTRYCVTCSSGTDALLIAMMALGVGYGDEVVTTPFTFVATVETIRLLGAKAVFVDIDPRTYNLNAQLLPAAITRRTKAIIPVSLYGQCADMGTINEVAAAHRLPVIEDGAQSFGATYKGRPSCGLSTIGCTSFVPSKPLGCYGDGGACFTQDEALASRMKQIRVHGQDRKYHHPVLGINGRLDTLQAAVLLAKLEVFDEEVAQRARLGSAYSELLQDVVTTPYVEAHNTCVYAQYTIRVENRPAFQEQLRAQGIPTAVHYPVPLHLQPAFASAEMGRGSFPHAEAAAERVVSLPMHPYLSEDDQQKIAQAVRQAAGERKMQAVIERNNRKQHVPLRLHPFLFDVLTTGLTQVASLAASFVLVGAVSKRMGVVALGEYLLVRRVSSWLLAASQLGMGIALPRQIAHTVHEVETRATQYFLATFGVLLVFLTGMGTVLTLNAQRVAHWCFGSENRSLVYAMVLFIFGTAVQCTVFGYFRGLERVQRANLVILGGAVVVPLLAFGVTYKSHSAPVLIGATGLGLAVPTILWAIPKVAIAWRLCAHLVGDARELLSYGVARIPGEIAFGGLLAVGPMLVSHYADMAQNSYLLLGITCLTMASLAFAPMSMVLLARISRLLAAGRREDLNEYVGHLRSAVLQLSLVVVLQGLVFARPIVLWWLGPSCVAGVPVISVVMLAIPAYMYFVAMRSVVDAASAVAYNARNVLVALAVLVSLFAALIRFAPRANIVIGVAAATTVAMYVLAFATHRTLRDLKLAERPPQTGAIWIAGLLALISITAQVGFHFQISKPAFGVVLLVNLALIFLFLRKSQPEWLGFVLRVAFPRT
jgi:UDP-2-acetamido-2-deoxy-ribo-hexuluronate aminotransferase